MSQWRSELFLGETREKFTGKSILIAGCGADGSHAAESLGSIMMHSADTKLVLTDPDIFEEANLGIQIVDENYLGVNKAIATKDMLSKKFVNIEIFANEQGVNPENIPTLIDDIDYVVDATDISVTGIASSLHLAANKAGIPVIVPWSLGFGGAVMSFDTKDTFDEWGNNSRQIAVDAGHEELKDIARWLVDLPKGLSKAYLLQVLNGEMPTPTTYFGAAAGGQLAARWICDHLNDQDAPLYPNVVINSTRGLNSCTMSRHYEAAIRDALLFL